MLNSIQPLTVNFLLAARALCWVFYSTRISNTSYQLKRSSCRGFCSECRLVAPTNQHQSRSNSSNRARTSCIRLRHRSSKSSNSWKSGRSPQIPANPPQTVSHLALLRLAPLAPCGPVRSSKNPRQRHPRPSRSRSKRSSISSSPAKPIHSKSRTTQTL